MVGLLNTSLYVSSDYNVQVISIVKPLHTRMSTTAAR